MTDQTFDRDYEERPPAEVEARTDESTPLVIGSRTRGPDERQTESHQAGDDEETLRALAAGAMPGPAFARQVAFAMEQKAVRIRRHRIETASESNEPRKKKEYLPSPTFAAITATLFKRESRRLAETFRRFFGEK